MAHLSFNLRGTSGTGKTFVARALMEHSKATHFKQHDVSELAGKPKGVPVYRGQWRGLPLYFLGSYEATCGGCDTIPKVAIVADLLQQYMTDGQEGVVFFEGLMISHMLGTVGDMQKQLGVERNVLAFLDTPLDVALDRIRQRRRDRGDERPLNTTNTEKDWYSVRRCKDRAIEQGFNVVSIHHRNAVLDCIHHISNQLDLLR